MKKIFTKMLICVLCLTAAFMCACVNNNGETPGGDPQTARLSFYTPDGAPALGEAEQRLVQTVAGFLGRQMES